MILIVDNLDSFTYNLVAYFKELGEKVEVITNEVAPQTIDFTQYKGVVLSPGPSLPKDANYLNAFIEVLQGKMPLLGVCLGHQALAEQNGARLFRMDIPFHGRVSKVNCRGNGLFKDIPDEIEVVRYHSWLVKDLPADFVVTASTDAGEIMAYENDKLKIDGLQFHPESILTKFGIAILNNWLLKINKVV